MTDRFPDAVLKQAIDAHDQAYGDMAYRDDPQSMINGRQAGYAAMRAVLEAHMASRGDKSVEEESKRVSDDPDATADDLRFCLNAAIYELEHR